MAQVSLLRGGNPVAADVIVSADQDTIIGAGTAQDPLRAGAGGGSFEAIISAARGHITVTKAQALTSVGVHPADEIDVDTCVGNAASQFAGLALFGGESGDTIRSQFAGVATFTTAEWDAVTGDSGGLSAGARYWVDQSTRGNITQSAPTTGQHAVQVGVGLSATQMLLTLSPPGIAP